jgi:hypothetical protein
MSNEKIECTTHGMADPTFVCQHLVKGEKLGFHVGYDPEIQDELCPDAWCNQCEETLNSEGEWNETSEAFADIKLLCSQCYEIARDRNWLEDSDTLDNLICSSFEYADEKQSSFIEKFKVNDHERWDWYQETGKLIFTHDGKPQVEADIHFSGSFSSKSNTWMWAWANQHLDEIIKTRSREVRKIGQDLHVQKLEAGRWLATEVDGWEMTSILAKQLGAIATYRTKKEGGFTYMVITKAEWVSKSKVRLFFGL